jgi:plasmid stabilization system protein ParE
MRVEFKLEAYLSLNEIRAFIEQDNPLRAKTFSDELVLKARDVAKSPYIYPYFDKKREIRKRSYKGYIIFYRSLDAYIEILLIVNSRRDYAALLQNV